MSLKQLRALASTVRLGTVTAAARELYVTPAAITTQLKIMERIVGTPIFDRARNGFVPTEAGRELLETALLIDKLMARSGERITALKSGAIGTVVLGAVSTAKYLVPAIAAEFQRAHPKIRVKLLIGNRSDIIAGLEASEYDLTIMGRPPSHVPLASTLLCDHPHVLIAAPEHRLGNAGEIEPSALVHERFLAREPGSGTRLLMERFIERIGLGQMLDVVEMGTNETIKQAVRAGLGIAIISAHTCLSELRERKLIMLPIAGLPLVRQWYLIQRADRELGAAAENLKSFVIAHTASLMPRLDIG